MAKNSRRGNGEGTITRRQDGRWEAKITLVDGRRKSMYGTTRQEVARKLTEARRALDMGMSVIADERLSVEEYCAQWLDQMQPPRVRPATHKRYRLLLAHLTRAYGDVRLTRLTAAHLATLYASVQRRIVRGRGRKVEASSAEGSALPRRVICIRLCARRSMTRSSWGSWW